MLLALLLNIAANLFAHRVRLALFASCRIVPLAFQRALAMAFASRGFEPAALAARHAALKAFVTAGFTSVAQASKRVSFFSASGQQSVVVAPNRAVNRTPNCCAVGFPPLRFGAGYFQR